MGAFNGFGRVPRIAVDRGHAGYAGDPAASRCGCSARGSSSTTCRRVSSGSGSGRGGQWILIPIALVVFVAFAWGLGSCRRAARSMPSGSDLEAARLAGIRPEAGRLRGLRRDGRPGRPGGAAERGAVRGCRPEFGHGPRTSGDRRGGCRRRGRLGGRGTLRVALIGVPLLGSIGPRWCSSTPSRSGRRPSRGRLFCWPSHRTRLHRGET